MHKFVVIAFICNIIVVFANECENIVEITNGKLCGESRRNYIAFEGIPYAEPPMDKNRFEVPKPYDGTWEGLRAANKVGNTCIQWHQFIPGDDKLTGSEDCLYLNVYTPGLDIEMHPVIVLIHGGAFMFGSSADLDPENLLKHSKFVFVTFNYRLGVLGFLSTADSQLPGNFGLKDQHLAIRWVKENIRSFNGDPNKMILAGPSAGGASVHLHLLSHQQNYANVAVSQSGSALNPWVIMHNPLQRAKKLGAYLNCPTNCTKKLKECLKQHDASEIVRATKIFQPFMYNPFTVFGPVVEGNSTEDSFLHEHPLIILEKGNFHKIPWMLSFVKDEGGYNAATLLDVTEASNPMEEFNKQWKELAPLMLFYNESVDLDRHDAISDKIKDYYVGDKDFSIENYWNIQEMFSQRLFKHGFHRSMLLHSRHAPVYSYFYKYPTLFNVANMLSQRTDIEFGTVHSDDVLIIFHKYIRPNNSLSPDEEIIQKNLVKLFESFIQKGNPAYGEIDLPQISTSNEEVSLLEISDGNNAAIATSKNVSDAKFWDEISSEESL